MKKLFLAVSVCMVVFGATAMDNAVNSRRIVLDLNGFRFTESVIAAWVKSYNEENPQSVIEAVIENDAKKADAMIVAKGISDDNREVYYAGRYVLLPVCNENNPLVKRSKKGFGKNEIKKLVFVENEWEDEENDLAAVNVYTRKGNSGTTLTLANFYGSDPDKIKGKKIVGDEKFLTSAIKLDANGFTFNSLNYLFDTQTRALQSQIKVLPLNIKQQYRTVLESQDIDSTIELFENNKFDIIPVEHFGFSVINQGYDSVVMEFISWVIAKGQECNHTHGFLKLEKHVAEIQLNSIKRQVDLAEAK